jgi:hypothetical protein
MCVQCVTGLDQVKLYTLGDCERQETVIEARATDNK